MHDSLYRNSVLLMASTVLISIVGFIFWKINTHIFTVEQVGIGVALISVSTLLGSLSIFGLDQTIIKALPKQKDRASFIGLCLSVISIAAIIFSIIYIVFLKYFSTEIQNVIQSNIIFAISFVVFTVVISINTFLDNVFVALKEAKYVLIKNIFASIAKLSLPIILVSIGAFGIFASSSLAQLIALLFAMYILVKQFNLRIIAKPNIKLLNKYVGFSLMNYASGILGNLPALILPIIIIEFIGPAQSAYFYLSLMIINIIAIIPLSTTNALFAEASHDILRIKEQVKKSLKVTFLLMIPAIVVLLAVGKYILLFFGNEYSVGGLMILNLLIISCIPIAVKNISGSVLRVYGRMKQFLFIEFSTSILIIGLSLLLINDYGLTGVGIAWIIGSSITAIMFSVVARRSLSGESATA